LLRAASWPTEPEAVSSEMMRPPLFMAGPAGRKGKEERGWLLTWTIAALPKAVKWIAFVFMVLLLVFNY